MSNANLIAVNVAQFALIGTAAYIFVKSFISDYRAEKAHKARVGARAARISSPEYAAARAASKAAWDAHLANPSKATFCAWKDAARIHERMSAY